MGRGYCVDGGVGFAKLTSFPRVYTSFPRHLRHSRPSPVIPADAGIQRKQSTPFPSPSGSVHNCCRDTLERESVVLPRCPSPLDSGFPRNDGRCAHLPFAERRGRVRSTQGMPENHHNPHFIHASNRNPRDSSVIPACLCVIPATPPSFPRVNTSFPRHLRHSRGRGNPEKDKARCDCAHGNGCFCVSGFPRPRE